MNLYEKVNEWRLNKIENKINKLKEYREGLVNGLTCGAFNMKIITKQSLTTYKNKNKSKFSELKDTFNKLSQYNLKKIKMRKLLGESII